MNIEGNKGLRNADPHSFSPYMENVELQKTSKMIDRHGFDNVSFPIFIDPVTKSKYVEIMPKEESHKVFEGKMSVQRFVSLLSKGVLRNSDVVEKDGRYFSRVIDLEKTSQARKGEMEADVIILLEVLGSCDHGTNEGTLAQEQQLPIAESKTVNHRNLITDDKTFAHYDYDTAFSFFGDYYSPFGEHFNSENDYKIRKDIIAHRFELELDYYKNTGSDIVKELFAKVEMLRSRLEDDEFLNAILKESKMVKHIDELEFLKTITERNKIEEFKKRLLKNISLFLEALKEVRL